MNAEGWYWRHPHGAPAPAGVDRGEIKRFQQGCEAGRISGQKRREIVAILNRGTPAQKAGLVETLRNGEKPRGRAFQVIETCTLSPHFPAFRDGILEVSIEGFSNPYLEALEPYAGDYPVSETGQKIFLLHLGSDT